jgi:hypothetical protein
MLKMTAAEGRGQRESGLPNLQFSLTGDLLTAHIKLTQREIEIEHDVSRRYGVRVSGSTCNSGLNTLHLRFKNHKIIKLGKIMAYYKMRVINILHYN